MTIEEAIQHCKEAAAENRQYALEFARVNVYDSARNCQECAAEHEQLAEWLTELKQRREAAATDETSNLSEVAGCDEFICKECGIHLTNWERVDGNMWAEEYEFKFCPNCGKVVREEVVE